jgi:hypothetical protein
MDAQAVKIPVDAIILYKNWCTPEQREKFNKQQYASILQLTELLRDAPVPILVRYDSKNEKYYLEDGLRRLYAVRECGLSEISALVVPVPYLGVINRFNPGKIARFVRFITKFVVRLKERSEAKARNAEPGSPEEALKESGGPLAQTP